MPVCHAGVRTATLFQGIDLDSGGRLWALLSFSFPRSASGSLKLVYLAQHPSQKHVCGCQIASGVLCRSVMFNRWCDRPHAAGVWTIIRVTVLLCCQVSSLCFSFPSPVPALRLFLFSFGGFRLSCFTKGSLCVYLVPSPENGCHINPKKEKSYKGNVGGKTSQRE